MPRHFGIVSPPVPGHIHPFGALGRELISRGHRVSFAHMGDLASRIHHEQLEFVPLGRTSHPEGYLPAFHREVTRRSGWPAMRYTIHAVVRSTAMFCEELPQAIEDHGIDVLLVDQMEPAGACVAERTGIPFVTVANALLLNREANVPPPFTPWSYSPSPFARIRNRLGYVVNDQVLRPVMRTVAQFRSRWGLKQLDRPEDFWSPLLQLCQMTPSFDFPRENLPTQFHYTGPLRRSLPVPGFPWERLSSSKPLVYASLGTLQNGKEDVFRKFAEACTGLGIQLLITHGGALAEGTTFPGDTVVVSYAPQIDVLARASLTLTHAGLNTVLDSLSQGVPLVAVPITYEQPAIASRLAHSGAGLSVALRRLQVSTLRERVQTVLSGENFAKSASRIGSEIKNMGGVQKAAELIETSLS